MYWSRWWRKRNGTILNIQLILRAYLCFLNGAIFVNDLCTYQYKSTSSGNYCSNCGWNWQRQQICFTNNCNNRVWLQKWVFVPFVFRRYQSGDIIWNSFRSVLLCCAVPSQLRNSSVFTHSYSDSSAATSSATGKYRTLPERPGRNEEQDSIKVSKGCAVRPGAHFSMKPWIPCNIPFNLMNLLVFS